MTACTSAVAHLGELPEPIDDTRSDRILVGNVSCPHNGQDPELGKGKASLLLPTLTKAHGEGEINTPKKGAQHKGKSPPPHGAQIGVHLFSLAEQSVLGVGIG